MPIKFSHVLALLAVLAPAIGGAADEPLTRGHEAFIERCAEDSMKRALDAYGRGVDFTALHQSTLDNFLNTNRDVCNQMYEDVDVCADGGAALALENMKRRVEVNEMLYRSLPGDDVIADMITSSTWELMALRSLVADPSTYCGAETAPTPSSTTDVVGETEEAGGGHDAFIQRCIESRMGDLTSDEMRKVATDLCREIYYRGLDVCSADDAAQAVKRFEYEISVYEWRLQEFGENAEDVERYESSIANYEVELAAVRDLIAGRISYCASSRTGN